MLGRSCITIVFLSFLLHSQFLLAETPEEYVRNYDSLEYSTTEWSEPVNSLQMRVTYPTEVDYGSDIDLTLEVLPSPGRAHGNFGGSAILRLTRVGTDSSWIFGPADFSVPSVENGGKTRCRHNASLQFPVAKLRTFVPLFQYPGGEEKLPPVTELEALPSGTYTAALSVLWSTPAGFATQTQDLSKFNTTIRQPAYRGHRIVILCPSGMRVSADCHMEYTGIDTIVVYSRPNRYVGTNVRCADAEGCRGKRQVPDTISFLGECFATAGSSATQIDFAIYSVFETIDPPGHFWNLSARQMTTLFTRTVRLSQRKEDIAWRERCREAKRK